MRLLSYMKRCQTLQRLYKVCCFFLLGPSDCADEPCDAFVVEETGKGFQCKVDVPSPLYK